VLEILVKESITKKKKCEYFLNGSACGVDLNLFNPGRWEDSGKQIRKSLKIPAEAIVIGVFGRLTREKGVNEMVSAFVKLSQQIDNIFLLVVGTQEEKDRLLPETEEIIRNHPRIRSLGWQKSLLPCYVAIDIFCLPSYREGFPQTPLEAQAMELPVVTTDIPGARESIIDGQTGLLADPRGSEGII
jgi:glycosyltransferase involved in cell wall biosynthesis